MSDVHRDPDPERDDLSTTADKVQDTGQEWVAPNEELEDTGGPAATEVRHDAPGDDDLAT
jgi:hypothetical protein